MFKISLINLFVLLSYNLFLGGEVNVNQNFPNTITAGDSFTMEVTFEKGDHEGFAKWQQELPVGFSAEPIKTEGATFSFKDQIVKLIWMEIPKDELFTVKYKIISSEQTKGNYKLTGTYSYLENNERKIFKCEDEITIAAEAAASIAEKEDSAVQNIAALPNVEISETVTSTDNININRKIIHKGEGKYQVDLTIDKKESMNKFGKVEEYIPNGFIASENKNEGGFFSVKRNIVKILWMTLPQKDEFTVSYDLESTSDELDSVTVHGVFSYLDGDVSKQQPMKGSHFRNYYGVDLSPEVEKKEEPSPSEIAVEEPMETKDDTPDFTEKKTDYNPNNELKYSVQIASSKTRIEPDAIKSKYNLRENVTLYRHNGWFMYIVGSFDTYKAAKSMRNNLWETNKHAKDAFIVAFKGDQRTSIQEALMLSNEKWSK